MRYCFECQEIEVCWKCPMHSVDNYGADGCGLLNDYLDVDIYHEKDERCPLKSAAFVAVHGKTYAREDAIGLRKTYAVPVVKLEFEHPELITLVAAKKRRRLRKLCMTLLQGL